MSKDRRRLFVTTIYFLEEPVNGSLRRDVATPPTSVPNLTPHFITTADKVPTLTQHQESVPRPSAERGNASSSNLPVPNSIALETKGSSYLRRPLISRLTR
ncbi:hypothetical protein CC2G_013661 [Coprinopsis cinerea AmutBmut pab1-1]|nr:hypothetical protein CC2G_013661 [Coprinopsis cinerea AmutBmut pab1-1]